MKRWIALIAAGLCLTAVLCGCSLKPEKKKTTTTTTTTTMATLPSFTAVDIDLKTLLTKEDVAKTTGAVFTEDPQEYMNEDLNVTLRFMAADAAETNVDISLAEATVDEMDDMAKNYEDTVAVPGIGDKAYWSAQYKSLLFHYRKYIIEVVINLPQEVTALQPEAMNLAKLLIGRIA